MTSYNDFKIFYEQNKYSLIEIYDNKKRLFYLEVYKEDLEIFKILNNVIVFK
jgi:hypothetical protein